MIGNSIEKLDLLIIGNGFDLKCGLNTKFIDYLNSFLDDNYKGSKISEFFDKLNSLNKARINDNHTNDLIYLYIYNELNKQLYNKSIIGNFNDSFINNLKSIDKSFFDFYFNLIKFNDSNWSDVEGKLSSLISTDFINDTFDAISNFLKVTKNAYEIRSKAPWENNVKINREKWDKWDSNTENFYQKYKSNFLFVFLMINVFGYKIYKHSPTYFIDFFFKQLNDFEKNVGEYIDNQSLRKNYLSNSKLLIEKFNIDNDYNVLNFNYTNPFEKLRKYFPIFQISNIHGTTNSPIIGVDSSVIKDDNKIKFNQFTKTYRIMVNTAEHQDILPKNISTIYFYGHSLAPADYSYFQSIFDYYDLYGSDVRLVFYYTVYDKDKENSIINEQINNIWNLINKYGKSMGSKKGENLLHKLNLENRIKIVKV